jgi:hypothetical protein
MHPHGGPLNQSTVDLHQGAQRLLQEDGYAEGVQKNFDEHVEKHSKLDALARCKALNAFLAENVCFYSLCSR